MHRDASSFLDIATACLVRKGEEGRGGGGREGNVRAILRSRALTTEGFAERESARLRELRPVYP